MFSFVEEFSEDETVAKAVDDLYKSLDGANKYTD